MRDTCDLKNQILFLIAILCFSAGAMFSTLAMGWSAEQEVIHPQQRELASYGYYNLRLVIEGERDRARVVIYFGNEKDPVHIIAEGKITALPQRYGNKALHLMGDKIDVYKIIDTFHQNSVFMNKVAIGMDDHLLLVNIETGENVRFPLNTAEINNLNVTGVLLQNENRFLDVISASFFQDSDLDKINPRLFVASDRDIMVKEILKDPVMVSAKRGDVWIVPHLRELYVRPEDPATAKKSVFNYDEPKEIIEAMLSGTVTRTSGTPKNSDPRTQDLSKSTSIQEAPQKAPIPKAKVEGDGDELNRQPIVQKVSEKVPFNPKQVLSPKNLDEFFYGLEGLREILRDQVVDQANVTDAMVDLWREIHLGMGKKHKSIIIAGPTGAGKTFSAEKFAEHALGDKTRFFEIDCTQFMGEKESERRMWSLLGAPRGTTGGEKGSLIEFLEKAGQDNVVIVFNEAEKADSSFWKMIMEALDKGRVRDGHDEIYRFGRALLVFTTNKGDDQIYPRDTGTALSRAEVERRAALFTDEDIKRFFMQPDGTDLYDQSRVVPPSALQRIDRAVVAIPQSFEGAKKILRQQIEHLSKVAETKHHVAFGMSEAAVERMVQAYFIPENGVRLLLKKAESLATELIQEAHRNKALHSGTDFLIDLKTDPKAKTSVFKVTAWNGEEPTIFELPAPEAIRIYDNPLLDSATRRKLATLEDNFSTQVFGQDEALGTTADAIRARALNTRIKQPAALLYLGPTGTGKTELAKAVAENVYGDMGRLEAFDMGNVKTEAEFNNFFGSARGYLGSGTMSPFEKFLQKYPEGGVALFDEIGNMGGGQSATKRDLLMKFYALLDEGTWTSPLGRKYDLSKYTLIFTSNEGQELFQDLPSDDLRLATWNQSKSQEHLTQMLKTKHGWPEPLIARFEGNIALFKPLVLSERARIAQKLIGKEIDQLAEQHGIKQVVFEPGFFETAGDSFFSHAQGARALRGVGRNSIGGLFGKALLEDYAPDLLAESTFKFSLSDNYAGKFSYPGKLPPKRKVELSLTVETPKESRIYKIDLADKAAVKRLMSSASIRATALHEAGHAIANQPELTSEVVDFVTVRSAGRYGGYARYVEAAQGGTLTREQAVARLGRLLAGREAERLAGFAASSGWSNDWEKARELAEKTIIEFGLIDQPLRLPIQAGKVNVEHDFVQRHIKTLLAEAEQVARNHLLSNWSSVRAVADQLIKKGHLSGTEFGSIVSRFDQTKYRRTLKPERTNPAGGSPVGCPGLKEIVKTLLGADPR